MKCNYSICPMPLLRFDVPKPIMTYLSGFGEYVTVVCYIWYIKGPRCNVIVDAGGLAEVLKTRYPIVEEIQSLEGALSKLGLKPDDIDIVILTHLHHDHAALAHRFRNAKVIVQSDELAFAKSPHALYKDIYRQEVLQRVDFEVIKGDYQIIEGIRVFLTPGHSPGGQSVAIETGIGTVVITGFCCTRENFESSEGIRENSSIIPPGVHLDVIQACNSMLRVKKEAKVIIPLHDAQFLENEVLP